MRVDEFDFELPPECIALRPAIPRDTARLLIVKPDGSLEDDIVSRLASSLQPGDVLVLNDTRVIPAQLEGIRLPRAPSTHRPKCPQPCICVQEATFGMRLSDRQRRFKPVISWCLKEMAYLCMQKSRQRVRAGRLNLSFP